MEPSIVPVQSQWVTMLRQARYISTTREVVGILMTTPRREKIGARLGSQLGADDDITLTTQTALSILRPSCRMLGLKRSDNLDGVDGL